MATWAETCSVEQRQLNVRPSTIKLHADGNLTSKLSRPDKSDGIQVGLSFRNSASLRNERKGREDKREREE
jgi:hypothetical protein